MMNDDGSVDRVVVSDSIGVSDRGRARLDAVAVVVRAS